jgi:hypothetical protein
MLRMGSAIKRNGAITALDGVSLEIARGEFLGLLGPTYIFGEVFGIRREASCHSGIPLAVVSERQRECASVHQGARIRPHPHGRGWILPAPLMFFSTDFGFPE